MIAIARDTFNVIHFYDLEQKLLLKQIQLKENILIKPLNIFKWNKNIVIINCYKEMLIISIPNMQIINIPLLYYEGKNNKQSTWNNNLGQYFDSKRGNKDPFFNNFNSNYSNNNNYFDFTKNLNNNTNININQGLNNVFNFSNNNNNYNQINNMNINCKKINLIISFMKKAIISALITTVISAIQNLLI